MTRSPSRNLDVEAKLACVDDLAQHRVDGAVCALQRGRDMLDVDLDADRGAALGQVLLSLRICRC
jgi:hypothetical protein